MTQWKLVPVEPTEEMLNAYGYGPNLCAIIWAAMLSAAPSPDGEEAARNMAIANIAKIMVNDYQKNDADAYHAWLEVLIACFADDEPAALSAMRPAPKLSEEDRARVEEVRERHDEYKQGFMDHIGEEADADRAFLLSLIDNLTEAG